MTIDEQIRVLCMRSNITLKELANRLGYTQQNLSNKLKRANFNIKELQAIAEAVGCSYEQYFVLPDGEKI